MAPVASLRAATTQQKTSLISKSRDSKVAGVPVALPAKSGHRLPACYSAKRLTTRMGSTDRNLVVAHSAAISITERISQPPRVVPDSLPRVYVYDHCPFCVRVRLALGLKNIKHEVAFMANDDKKTPTALVGKKIAPILEMEKGFDKVVMGESMDIIALFDSDPAFGPTNFFKPASGRADIKAWQKSVKDDLRILHRPRYMQAALPEFQQRDSREYFVFGHPVPPYEKADWKADEFGHLKRWRLYDEALAQTDALLPKINAKLIELDAMIASECYCTEGGLSLDDVDLWARLRSMTLVKGLVWPPKLRAYMENLSVLGDVPLYFGMQV